MAQLRRRPRQHEVLPARADRRHELQRPPVGVALAVGRRLARSRRAPRAAPAPADSHVPGDAADGARRTLHLDSAAPGGRHRRRDRDDALGPRPTGLPGRPADPLLQLARGAHDVVVTPNIISDGAVRKEAPPGWLKGIDARTSDTKWMFRTVPQGDDFGVDSWGNESWRYSGSSASASSMIRRRSALFVLGGSGCETAGVGDFVALEAHRRSIWSAPAPVLRCQSMPMRSEWSNGQMLAPIEAERSVLDAGDAVRRLELAAGTNDIVRLVVETERLPAVGSTSAGGVSGASGDSGGGVCGLRGYMKQFAINVRLPFPAIGLDCGADLLAPRISRVELRASGRRSMP